MGALLPWRSFRELDRLSREIEENFQRLRGRRASEHGPEEYAPAIESYIHNGHMVVRVELPGIDPKDVEIAVFGDVLRIKAERKERKEIKREDYLRRELCYGKFERRVTLPEGAHSDKIRANIKNGIVEITIPVAKEVAPRKVPIEGHGNQK